MAKKSLNIHLFVIDPQNDFMGNDDGTPYAFGNGNSASLSVPGAVSDMRRLAAFVDRVGNRLADIHVTLDSHQLVDIAHPAFWRDQNNRMPGPFTIIKVEDIESGIWTTYDPGARDRALQYARDLRTASTYDICIWPPHCLIGTAGHNVFPELNDALQRWAQTQYAMIDFVTKGSNPWTEHYGALQAEVPDPSDPTTTLNTDLLKVLAEADIIAVAGEASSHCVLKTVMQIADNIGDEHIKKFHLLEDCMSPVPAIPNVVDFPAIAKQFFVDMKRRGMAVTTSTEFLK